MTSLAEAGEAIVDRFISAFPDIEVTLSTEDYTPSSVDNTWVRLVYRLASGGQRTLGKSPNRRFERIGIIFVQLSAPPNRGTYNGEVLGKAIGDLYESTTFNGVTCESAQVRDQGNQNGRHEVNIDIDFKYYEIK